MIIIVLVKINMKHFILYAHDGSRNHGCEALVRTTAELLDYKNNKITLASFRPEEDYSFGLDNFCDIHRMFELKKVERWNPKWIKAYIDLKINHKPFALDDLLMLSELEAQKGDIALLIGGDTYCYNDISRLLRSNKIWRRNGIKTVLWGCSINPDLLNDPIIAEDISKFDLITARESISYEAIKKVNKNTIQVSDSAFNLRTVKKSLPKGFENIDIVGLNLSPLAEGCESKKGITRENYYGLIEYILSKTTMGILLIPHVLWSHDNDNTLNEFFIKKYGKTGRVKLIEECNCEELKGYIAQCRFFVGARTHATIAAYSNSIPTLVMGYSVKSKGIAKDLFGEYNHYVLPIQQLENSNDLLNAFLWLQENELQIKKCLTKQMLNYKNSVIKAIEQINSL